MAISIMSKEISILILYYVKFISRNIAVIIGDYVEWISYFKIMRVMFKLLINMPSISMSTKLW